MLVTLFTLKIQLYIPLHVLIDQCTNTSPAVGGRTDTSIQAKNRSASRSGQSEAIGPLQPVVASVGDNITLPCHLEPAVDAAAITFEWIRPDLKPRFVHVWRSGENLMDLQNPSFKGRTSIFSEKLKSGDISLKLSKIKPSDEGKYRCFLPLLEKETFVELIVGK